MLAEDGERNSMAELRRPAVSPERHAKQNQNQNHSGGVASRSEEAE